MAIGKLDINCPPCTMFQPISTDYKNNLTYEEFLLGILKKMNVVIDSVNVQQEFIDKFEVEYAELIKEFERLRDEFGDLEARILENVLAEQAKFEEKVTNLISETRAYLIAYSDAGDARLESMIRELELGKIKVIDPTSGMLADIQTVINNIAGVGRNALTATEYDALNLTATAYDAKQISAYDYDYNGKTALAV